MQGTLLNTAAECYRVVVAEDHPLVRLGLEQSLADCDQLELAACADNTADAWRLVREHDPDAVIVDLTLCGGDGIDLVRRVATHRPTTAIVVSSMHEQAVYEARVLQAGAHAYVSKDRPISELLSAVLDSIAQARLGGRTVPAPWAPDDSDPATEGMTNRELEVFRLIGAGLSTKQIAARLQRSVKTVESFKSRLKQKLQLASGDELTREAVRWAVLKGVG